MPEAAPATGGGGGGFAYGMGATLHEQLQNEHQNMAIIDVVSMLVATGILQ